MKHRFWTGSRAHVAALLRHSVSSGKPLRSTGVLRRVSRLRIWAVHLPQKPRRAQESVRNPRCCGVGKWRHVREALLGLRRHPGVFSSRNDWASASRSFHTPERRKWRLPRRHREPGGVKQAPGQKQGPRGHLPERQGTSTGLPRPPARGPCWGASDGGADAAGCSPRLSDSQLLTFLCRQEDFRLVSV